MELFSTITKIFNPDIIYQQSFTIMKYYMYLIPIFFGVSVAFRMLEESVDNIGGNANFSKAFQDAFTTSLIVFSYAGIAMLACEFIMSINNYVGEQGSFSVIFKQYFKIINDIKDVGKDNSWGKDLLNLGGIHIKVIAGCIFSITFAILSFVHLFLRFAYAVLFCFLVTWGAIAIATTPSKIFSLKGGFIATLKGLIVWPIVESIFYVLAGLVINQAGQYVSEGTTAVSVAHNEAFAYLLFSFTNIFLVAVIIAAASVSFFLSQNQNAMAGITAPFTAAGIGAGVLMSTQIKKFGGPAVGRMGGKVFSSFKNVAGDVGSAGGRKFAGTGIGNIITTQAGNVKDLLNKDILANPKKGNKE